MRTLVSRLMAMFGHRDVDAQLDDDVRAHLDLLEEDYVRRGMSADEARFAARRAFGAVEPMKERHRDQRPARFLAVLIQDLRYALRSLRKNPVFASVAVASLAIGIGANSAMFTLLDAAILRDLPVREPGELAAVQPRRGPRPALISYPVFRDLSSRQRTFSEIAASGNTDFRRARLEGRQDDLTSLGGQFVSANYFSMLGVRAAFGRVFTPADSPAAGQGAVAVLSYRFWERNLGSDPAVVGQTIVLDDVPFAIVGIAARGFFGDRVGAAPDIWIPILMQPSLQPRNMLEARTASWFRIIGRLAPGIDERQSSAEWSAIFRQLKADEIASGSGSLTNAGRPEEFSVEVVRGDAGLNRQRTQFRRPLSLLMGAVAIVLLIVCCNVATLLMTRARARQREIAIRLAIGAGRGRVIRQLLTESLLLSVIGAALGFLLARWATDGFAPQLSLGAFELNPDLRTFGFTVLVATLGALVFGLAPALQISGIHVTPALQASAPSAGRRSRFAPALVVVQVALSLWLLVGAGLLLRTLHNFNSLDIGVDRDRLLTVRVSADPKRLLREQMPGLRADLEEALEAIPGVASVGFAEYGLFLGSARTAPVRVPDSPVNPANDPDVRQNFVSPEYFETVGVRLARGRGFRDTDVATAQRVTIVNETMARHYFGDADPIGRMVYFPKVDNQRRYLPFPEQFDRRDGAEIVGVVRDIKYDNLREGPIRMAYLPMAQDEQGLRVIALRATTEPPGLIDEVRRTVSQVNPGLTATITTLEDDIRGTLAQEHLVTRLLSFFGALSILLACIGVYGVVAYTVVQRMNEIGVRIALGARRQQIVNMVATYTLRLAGVGIALGFAAALGTTRFLDTLLFGLTPTDSTTLALAAVVMVAVALFAAAIPAVRAARSNPILALRSE